MEKKEVLLTLARAAIAEAVGLTYPVNVKEIREQNSWLEEEGACFVTLTVGVYNMLRGCIGSIVAHRPLFDDLMHNARSAALNDPRFPSLTQEEFDRIIVEVSILTQPVRVEYGTIDELKSKIIPGIHGVILKQGYYYQATYLPQVWEQLPDFDAFFQSLCMKAGLEEDCLGLHPEISTYEVKKYKEN